MKFVGNYNRIVALLAIAVLFSTVAPVRVSAETVPFVTNFVYSSQQTGGVSQNGEDGVDGKDGKDGKDGAPGKAGASVVNIDSNNTASVHIESTINGTKVLDIQKTHTENEGSVSVAEIHTSTSSAVGVASNLVSSTSIASSQSAPWSLKEALFSLQLMLLQYVSVFF